MNTTVDGIAAEASSLGNTEELPRAVCKESQIPLDELPAHSFGKAEEHGEARECGSPDENLPYGCGETQGPSTAQVDPLCESTFSAQDDRAGEQEDYEQDWETERERRVYRARTVAMLRRYMRYSIETGRLPSLLGREFFRAKVTSYTVVTFEDRVIFVHDMERCLEKLDEFSRQIIARHILQEHDQAATGRLLNCTERTVRTYVPIALDLLSEILIDVGLLERAED